MKFIITGIIIFLFSSGLYSGDMTEQINLNRSDLKLNRKELKWLSSGKVIRIAGPRAFQPFHYYNEQGNLKGISADYILTILDQLGIKYEIHKNLPWPEVLKKTEAGEIDLIPCIAKSKDRCAYLNFTRPYLSFPIVILSSRDSPFIGGASKRHFSHYKAFKTEMINKSQKFSS